MSIATTGIVYVGTGAAASDSNDGLTAATAKATLTAAKAVLGSGTGTIQLLSGTFHVTSADASGNGITLDQTGMVLQGLGQGLTTISLETSLTWGVKIHNSPRCVVRDLFIDVPATGSVTHICGVSTPSTGSAESSRFINVFVSVESGGTATNAFAVGPDNPGSSSMDIAQTTFINCEVRAQTAITNGWLLGNGTSGNVLATRLYSCGNSGASKGINFNGCGGGIFGGAIGNNSIADFYVSQPNTDAITIEGGSHGENSASLLGSGIASSVGPQPVNLRDVLWTGETVVSTGRFIQFGFPGPLTVENLSVLNMPHTAVIVLNCGGVAIARFKGIAIPAALSSSTFLFGGGTYGVTVENYFQVAVSGSSVVAEWPGLHSFGTLAYTTTTTAPGAGGAGALPATPAGYVTQFINGTSRQIPYY